MWFYGLSVAARVFHVYEAYLPQIMIFFFFVFQKVECFFQKKRKEIEKKTEAFLEKLILDF